MIYQETFQVSNMVVDRYFADLTGAEAKLLIVIFRQTHGWVDKRTGKRKTRDWISHSQFVKKTGLSRRVISTTVQSLVAKGLVNTTDQSGKLLPAIEDRRGQPRIFYALNMCTFRQEPVHFFPTTCAVHNTAQTGQPLPAQSEHLKRGPKRFFFRRKVNSRFQTEFGFQFRSKLDDFPAQSERLSEAMRSLFRLKVNSCPSQGGAYSGSK